MRSLGFSRDRLLARYRVIVGIGVVLTVSVLCYFFPPLHVTRLTPTLGDQSSSDHRLDTKASARQFWEIYQPTARSRAVDIQTIFDALDADPQQAHDEFSRQVGLGSAYFYFVRGVGKIEKATPNSLIMTIDEHQRRASFEIGMIVGNTVCDATDWVDINQFDDQQSFNNLSAELNRQIESEVLAPMRDHFKRGTRLEFVGCARINDEADLDPLSMVPVWLKIIPRPR